MIDDRMIIVTTADDKFALPLAVTLYSALTNLRGVLSVHEIEAMQRAQNELLRDPFILHFTGPAKPCHFVCRGPAISRFFHYLQKSHWLGDIDDISLVGTETWEKQNEYEPWLRDFYAASHELEALIPSGATFILVDENTLSPALWPDRCRIPFIERGGMHWGPPSDDETAIQEMERLRNNGADFIVFAWPAFWWLDHYIGFSKYLSSEFACVLRNSRLVAFDLRTKVAGPDKGGSIATSKTTDER